VLRGAYQAILVRVIEAVPCWLPVAVPRCALGVVAFLFFVGSPAQLYHKRSEASGQLESAQEHCYYTARRHTLVRLISGFTWFLAARRLYARS
jgi:hypothetical protein